MLIFGNANAKLKPLERMVGKIATFSLLSGHTCPFAHDCLSKAVETPSGIKVEDGPHTLFRCFSASNEALFPSVYNARKTNTEAIKACGNNLHKITELILENLPEWADTIRIHIGGDFFTLNYLLAWCEVARLNSSRRFYGYTKALPLWVKAAERKCIPPNLILTASYGGTYDSLISKYNLRYSKVVFSENEATELGLEIDHDDFHAATVGPSFALLVHGTQPKGSEASKALQKLGGIGGESSYGKSKN